MRIDATSAGLILNAISTIIVVVGALAGLRQLRHIRHGNELATLTEISAQFDTSDMQASREFLRLHLPAAMDDPAFLAELRETPVGPRARHVVQVAKFFELLGVYISSGALSERMAVTIWGVIALRYWRTLRNAIAVFCEKQMVFGFFEDLAMRSERYLQSGAFRARVKRLQHDPELEGRARTEETS